MDVGFLILCPDRNPGGLKSTLGSIRLHSYNRESLCVVGSNATAQEVKELKDLCATYKGKDTITSLVNTGMKKSKHEWTCIVFAGSRIQAFLERRWKFATKETDILFPVLDRKFDFVEGSFNGVLVNTKFFQKVGDLPTAVMKKNGLNDFEFAKFMWAVDAIEHGASFKGIVGMRII